MMSPRRRNAIAVFSAAAALALSGVGQAHASQCGFPGMVVAGTAGGGTGFVLFYQTAPPFAYQGGGAVPLGTPQGDACMDIWRESTIGPAPPNFNAVWATSPAVCASGFCDPTTPTICSPVTLCMAFP